MTRSEAIKALFFKSVLPVTVAEYKAARTEAQEYDTVKQNVDALLTVPKEQEQQRRHELE